MSHDEFTRLFKHMNLRFDQIDQTLANKADQATVQASLGLIDTVIKQQEESFEERLIVGHQLARLDRWAHSLARKIGYKLSA